MTQLLTNPIQYTSTDFDSVMNDINNDPDLKDKPVWFKRLIAGARDGSAVMENAIANQSLLRTAFTRQAVADLCALIDYQLTAHSTSIGDLTFYLDPNYVAFPVTFSVTDLKAQSQGSMTFPSLNFETLTGMVVNASSENFTTDFTTGKLTVAGVYATGDRVRLTTTGTLPSPLQLAVSYYVIYVSATQIKLAASVSDAFAGTAITLTTNGTGVHTISMFSFHMTVYQQQSLVNSTVIGTSDGVTQWQFYQLPDLKILDLTLAIVINSVTWTQVTSFVNSISTDTVYKIIHLQNGASGIMFGNGIYGAIPGAFPISSMYAVGGGSSSNISSYNRITAYSGGNSNINGVTNSQYFTGGADEQSIIDAKIIAPMLLKARSHFMSSADGLAFASAYPGVCTAGIYKNQYGLMSCGVSVVPSGGGTPSAPLLANLQAYLIGLTLFESVDVRTSSALYLPQNPYAQVNITTGSVWATVQAYVVLAFRLLFFEAGKEIQTAYSSGGISAAVAYINVKWGTSFTSADYNAIKRMLLVLEPAVFGQVFQESEVLGFIQEYVTGVNYLTITSPTFPIVCAQNQITQANVNPANITQVI